MRSFHVLVKHKGEPTEVEVSAEAWYTWRQQQDHTLNSTRIHTPHYGTITVITEYLGIAIDGKRPDARYATKVYGDTRIGDYHRVASSMDEALAHHERVLRLVQDAGSLNPEEVAA